MDELQAAFLRVKLRHLDAWNARRRSIADYYLEKLSRDKSHLILPFTPEWAGPVWHLFVVRHHRRDAVRERLAAEGIDTLIHYPVPPHRSDAYNAAGEIRSDFDDYHIALEIAETAISLPIGAHMSTAHADAVVTALRAAET